MRGRLQFRMANFLWATAWVAAASAAFAAIPYDRYDGLWSSRGLAAGLLLFIAAGALLNRFWMAVAVAAVALSVICLAAAAIQ